MSVWNDAWRVEALKRMWLAGETSGAIAEKLGVGRGAVMSKVGRLGLPPRAGNTTSSSAAKAARKKQITKPAAQITAERAKALAEFTAAEARANAEASTPSAERVTILVRKEDGKLYANPALTASRCRAPLGDPRDKNFAFCGRQKVSGLSYCIEHARLFYQPVLPSWSPEARWPIGGTVDRGLEPLGQMADNAASESRVKESA